MNCCPIEKVILFGVGINYSYMKELLSNKYNIIALCDNSVEKQGKTFDGYKCIALADILDLDFDKIIIMPNDFFSMHNQLLKLGVIENKIRHSCNYVNFNRFNNDKLESSGEIIEIQFNLFECFKPWAKNADDEMSNLIRGQLSQLSDNSNLSDLALCSYDSLQDNESRNIYAYLFIKHIVRMRYWNSLFCKIIRKTLENRLSEKGKDLSGYSKYDNDFFFGKEYFYLQNEDWMTCGDNEIFIDCGAFDGRTIKEFINYCGGKYKKIYSFEPIPNQYENTVKNINDAGIKNVEILQKGVWNKTTKLKFSDSSTSSSVDNNGTISVDVASIDEVVPENEIVTFIKMDIEGAELEALKGAANTIRRCKPKLAICIYHKPSDIIEIPIIIKSILPEYKFYIRHHSPVNWETVLYAQI